MQSSSMIGDREIGRHGNRLSKSRATARPVLLGQDAGGQQAGDPCVYDGRQGKKG